MTTVITLQPAPRTDHITEDGTELTQLPYPFHVDADTGLVQRQDFWNGEPYRVVGFAADLHRQRIDLWWDEAAKAPQRAVGMYVVTQDRDGNMGTHLTAIQSARDLAAALRNADGPQ